MTEYGLKLREKQKVRNLYGLSETQFRNYVKSVSEKRKTGNPAERLYELLEGRLDNVVYRMALGKSRSHARQLVAHGHITVNGRRQTVPSFKVRVGDVVEIREGSKPNADLSDAVKRLKDKKTPDWLSINPDTGSAKITEKPKEKNFGFDLTSIIEFYSR